jgi:alpha-beta hydrolase superfamily lysophospholipase
MELVNEPLYFTSGDQQLFGWLHRSATASAATVGLVICKPFGYEALCAHRSIRAFAEAAAEQGIPTLRFDYLGSGDSADIDSDADQITAWTDDVVSAVTELRRRTGVERVCLLGIRLGALLAVLAAARCTSVQGLIMIAPVISGKRYLRELRTARLAALLGAVSADSPQDQSEIETASPGAKEMSGYAMSAATLDSLSSVELDALTLAAHVQVLVIDRDDLPTAYTWSQSLLDAGVATQYASRPGFVEMALSAPQFSVIPQAMLDLTLNWLRQSQGAVASHDIRSRVAVTSVATSTVIVLPGNEPAADARLTERPVVFGKDRALFGIVTEPRSEELRRRAVILLNTGADSHIGASRMNVSLARNWARRGYSVLRMDLAGLGDAHTRPGRPSNEVFPPAAIDDVNAAIELMQSQYGVGDVTLLGLCSGAYHALRSAAAGAPVARILLVNPQTYFWEEGQSIEDIQLMEIVNNPSVHRRRARSVQHWKRLLTGQVDILRIVRVNLHRIALALESGCRDLARQMRIRLPHDLGWELEDIASRGVQVVFVFAHGEVGIELLRLQAGSAVARLGERCRVHTIASADHTFSQSGPRRAMEMVLSEELFTYVPSRRASRDRRASLRASRGNQAS